MINEVQEPVSNSQFHTYPDGSQVVGCPPFPEKSPKERAASDQDSVGVQAWEEIAPSAVPDANVVTAYSVEVSPLPPVAGDAQPVVVKVGKKAKAN